MGVEYRHFIVVHKSGLLPEPDTAIRVDAVLRDWSLVSSDPSLFDLTDGALRAMPGLIPETDPGAGLALVYPELTGAAVNDVFGPSYYGEEGYRYLHRISVVIGTDFRIHPSSEAIYFNVIAPPHDGVTPVEAYPEDEHSYRYNLWHEAYRATSTTAPPRVDVEIHEPHRPTIAWTEYRGFWRCAVILDCGKDLPKFVVGKHTLPSQRFVQQIAEAFRSPIVEVGEIY